MKQGSDCDVFQRRLDVLKTGGLAQNERALLESHADACPDCAMLLRLHDHLALPPQEDLEAAVPMEMVSSLRSRLAADLTTRRALKAPERWGRGDRGWLTPALAAAAVLLLGTVGLFYSEVQKLRDRERTLVERVAEQQSRLVELELRPSIAAVGRTARLAGRSGWERLLARKGRISVAELSDLLGRLPSGTTVYSRSEFEALSAGAPVWLTRAWRATLAGVEADDGIQVEELMRLLDDLAVDPRRSIPTARLLAGSNVGERS